MTIKIKSGGQVEKLRGRLSNIKIYCDEKTINMWLESDRGDESLTYLTLKEAIELKNALNAAIHNA